MWLKNEPVIERTKVQHAILLCTWKLGNLSHLIFISCVFWSFTSTEKLGKDISVLCTQKYDILNGLYLHLSLPHFCSCQIKYGFCSDWSLWLSWTSYWIIADYIAVEDKDYIALDDRALWTYYSSGLVKMSSSAVYWVLVSCLLACWGKEWNLIILPWQGKGHYGQACIFTLELQ